MADHVMPRLLFKCFFLVVQMLTALRGDSRCKKTIKTCPPGYQMSTCSIGSKEGHYCEPCPDLTFQPDVNRDGDRCRYRKTCHKHRMEYKDRGSIERDADCTCKPGYHFETVDQRACVPNNECPVGFGQGSYGGCDDCFKLDGYSDVNDRIQRCQKLRDCGVEKRCLVKRSAGSTDNTCSGSVVDNISQCNQASMEGVIIGCVMGVAAVIVVAFVAFLCRRNRRRYKSCLNGEKTDDIIRTLLEMSRKDCAFTSNVLEKSCATIEEKIPKQEWALAQELFRGHPETSKYEDLLFKYKGQTQKESTQAYLEEWRQWKGDTPETIATLFQCLRKCDRDDIVETICKHFRHDPDVEMNSSRSSGEQTGKYNLCPCKRKSNKENDSPGEETKPLQPAPDVVIQMYPALTGPTAPILEDSYVTTTGSNSNLTYPVQATTT